MAIDEPGLLYGATVFTTLRVYHQSLAHTLTNWAAHCDRLRNTLQIFGWQHPDWHRLRQGAETLILHFPVLRITIFPSGKEWITGRFLPTDLIEKQHYGVAVSTMPGSQFQRYLPAYKTGNYLSTWLAKTAAQQLSAQEAILVDESGNWLETSTGNLWGWQDGNWWTPPVAVGILPGVARSQLIDWLESHNQQVKQEPWCSEIVQNFEAIAYTNSVVEVMPIHTVIQQQGALKYDPFYPKLQQLKSLYLDGARGLPLTD